MLSTRRPYLIIPKLIEQPTWGGNYIVNFKNWQNKQFLNNKKIGQSYELFSQSKILLTIEDTDHQRFVPELGSAESDKTINKFFPYIKNRDYVTLSSFIDQNRKEVLGKAKTMALLIKFTQAIGNSFQVHIRPNVKHCRWRAKAESWYYLENGLLTYGIKKGINLNQYQQVCLLIDKKMHQLSENILTKKIDLHSAKDQALRYIKQLNPWQFVNYHQVNKNSLIDLSHGGVHHSWEEDMKNLPHGNVLYEMQQDVMDPISTVRSFDKGKLKNDGNLREINIDDYFQFIDTDSDHNQLSFAMRKKNKQRLLTTKHYCLDNLETNNKMVDYTNDSFCHLFVRQGDINIIATEGQVRLAKGHSCFLPQNVGQYLIKCNHSPSVILKTFVEI